jgi:hypothetical protein
MDLQMEEIMKKTFTETDVGCWIDGALGIRHSMLKLREMIHTCPNIPEKGLDTILATGNPRKLSDDFSEFSEAEEILQSNTDEGLIWVWETGDLMLADERKWMKEDY